ncbi:HAD family hydrolase [Pseudoclavibacter endophyticus]|uniref:HAD family hydrolase n=1 Tax=Pseudoclavibacter endophyticus TaxID=1778590 RepID=UPI001CE47AE6|nr:HAD-IA family hydrolase [Pseudoclavibacter endophyticus]
MNAIQAVPATDIRALLLDLDGVVTPTAEVHRRAWAALFSNELRARGASPDYSDDDYFTYIDGKPRHDGVRDLLASRGIALHDGLPTDAPDAETVWGLGNRKNDEFARILAEEGVTPYPGSIALIDAAEAAGIAMAIVTSSRNGKRVLEAAGLADRFPVVVDGVRAAQLQLPGKPSPATYLRAAEELGVPAADCAVVEDAISGVAVGADGDFGLIIGVDRGVGEHALRRAGAHVVVSDLAELVEHVQTGALRWKQPNDRGEEATS